MQSLTVLIQKGAVCQCLRDKKMYYESDELPPGSIDVMSPAEREAQMPAGPFWCALTQGIQGPDGKLVDAENCRPGRGCCETA